MSILTERRFHAQQRVCAGVSSNAESLSCARFLVRRADARADGIVTPMHKSAVGKSVGEDAVRHLYDMGGARMGKGRTAKYRP